MNFNNPEGLISYFDTLNIIVYLDWDDRDFVDKEDHKDDGWKFCPANIATTHIILKDKNIFKANINSISGLSNLIKGSRIANIMFTKRNKNLYWKYFVLF